MGSRCSRRVFGTLYFIERGLCMSQQEEWTVRRLLEWTTDFFKGHSFDSPRLEAELLLACAMKCSRIELYTRFDMVAGDDTRAVFRQLVQRRGRGEPVAYLVGHKEFYSLDFLVDTRVLIPRPETEQLVLEAIEYAKSSPSKAYRICDLGTGCGNIALSLAANLRQASVVAVDCSADALEVAQENARRLQLDLRVTWYQSDLFASVPSMEQFDILVSNPPYVSESEYASLSATVRDYEPRNALVAGPTGLETVARIARESLPFMTAGSGVFIETSPMIVHDAADVFEKIPDWTDVTIVSDFFGKKRFVIAKKNG